MRAAKHAPRDPFRVLEGRHGRAEIVERGAGGMVERLRVNGPDFERNIIILSEDASNHGHRFAHEFPGLFEALHFNKGISVVGGCHECVYIFLAKMPRIPRVYVSLQLQGLFHPSEIFIRVRDIALHAKYVVCCALGWACWKTYVGLPETDMARRAAMTQLGNGLYNANHCVDALTVKESELSMRRRLDDSESNILIAQSNLANTYETVGRNESAMSMRKDAYYGFLKLYGEEHRSTLLEADNYALSLADFLQRFEEAKSLLRKLIPVAQRVLGESDEITLKMRRSYARMLYRDPDATLDELHEAVTTLDDAARIAQRVFGVANPMTKGIESDLRNSRKVLRAREDGKRVTFKIVKH